MNTLFDMLEQIPVWSEDSNGNLTCTDIKTGKVLSKKSKPTLKDGSNINFFTPYKAILVKEIDIYNEDIPSYIKEENISKVGKIKTKIKKATEVYVAMKPNGRFFLAHNAKMGPSMGEDINISDFSFI
jgi:hypothetical protein